MNTIDIQDNQELYIANPEQIRSWAQDALAFLKKNEHELSIVLVDDSYIQDLNREYLGRDNPTNVISFPQQEGEGPTGTHLGDIVISVERASHEALDAGMSTTERLAQLVVHGICHLCGYNHEGDQAHRGAEMEAKEQAILNNLKII